MSRQRVLKFEVQPSMPASLVRTRDGVRQWLAVGWQDKRLCVWVEAEPGDREEPIVAVPTGGTPPDDGVYVGTAQTDAFGPLLVMHVYRLPVSRV